MFDAVGPKVRDTELFPQSDRAAEEHGHPRTEASAGHVVQRHRYVDYVIVVYTASIESPERSKNVASS